MSLDCQSYYWSYANLLAEQDCQSYFRQPHNVMLN